MEGVEIITSPVVDVEITSSISSFVSQKRFQRDLTVAALKGKLEVITGAACGTMKVEVFGKDDRLVCTLTDNDSMLGSFQIDDGMRLHVTDTSGSIGQYEDTSKVEKFELSQDEYEKRTDSVRAFKERMKMGRFADVDPEEQQKLEEEKMRKESEEEEKAKSMKVGDRCEVSMPGQAVRRGAVAFVGLVSFKPGYWIGVHYDEPVGKNNGSVQGKQYFDCPPKYGGFVKPAHVIVGDFPEEFDLEDDEL